MQAVKEAFDEMEDIFKIKRPFRVPTLNRRVLLWGRWLNPYASPGCGTAASSFRGTTQAAEQSDGVGLMVFH